jgi:hypothetical protein
MNKLLECFERNEKVIFAVVYTFAATIIVLDLLVFRPY